jgi:hypothetical protein
MNKGRLEFDYKELMEYLEAHYPLNPDEMMQKGYEYCIEDVRGFFLDKLRLEVVR